MENYLKQLLQHLIPVIGDYASVSAVQGISGTRLRLSVLDSGEQFEFAESAELIVRHVASYASPPLWDPAVDTEADGKWRLFAAHIKEAMETATSDQRILALDKFGLVSKSNRWNFPGHDIRAWRGEAER